MKKNILIIAISLICVSNAMAQKIGIKAGANFSNASFSMEHKNVSVNYPDYFSRLTSFYAGVSVSFKLNNKLSIQPEASLSFEGVKSGGEPKAVFQSFEEVSWGPKPVFQWENKTFTTRDPEGIENSFIYFNLPIMAKYKIINAFSLELGPQLGYLIDAKSSYNDVKNVRQTKSITKDYNQLNLSMNFGAEYVLPMGISFNARYSLGIANILHKDPTSIMLSDINVSSTTKVFSVGMGYYFKK